jgi:hypothetical protein
MRALAVLAVPLALLALAHTGSPSATAAAQKDKGPALSPTPVETNMHDFMEGVFQAPYRRLKAAMAAEPKDAPAWKAIRSDALILAEGENRNELQI